MQKKFLVLGLLATTAITSTAPLAFADDDTTLEKSGRPETPANMEKVQAALAAGDYETWIKLMGEDNGFGKKILAVIDTESEFDKFATMHEAMQSGDKTTAEALRTELGLEKMQGRGGKRGERCMGEGSEMKEIFDNLDYDGWVELETARHPESPMLEVITADNFEKFAQMHEAMQSGDKATAEALRTELGLEKMQGRGPKGEGRGGMMSRHGEKGQGQADSKSETTQE